MDINIKGIIINEKRIKSFFPVNLTASSVNRSIVKLYKKTLTRLK